jgi:hypothetical protein
MSTIDHEAFISRFAAACRPDPRIAAAFAGGSRGAGTADEHADSDLYLILRDEAYDDFFADRRDFMGRLGHAAFLEDFNGFGFDMLLFIYEDGVEGELVLGRASGFDGLASGPFRALLDRDGILPRQGFPPIAQPAEEEQREQVRWLVYWFWRDLSQLSRSMARGRLWSAYAHLEMMRHTCLGLVRVRRAFGPSLGSYHKIELVVDAEDLVPFQRTFCRVERDAIVEAVGGLLDIYWQVAPPLAATHGVAYPANLERTVLRRLAQACGPAFDLASAPS